MSKYANQTNMLKPGGVGIPRMVIREKSMGLERANVAIV